MGRPPDPKIEAYCILMHDTYERAARKEGWKTQDASAKPWDEVPDANKRTMRAAVRALVKKVQAEQKALDVSIIEEVFERAPDDSLTAHWASELVEDIIEGAPTHVRFEE